ncbi:MAG: hypothetical protein WBY47_03865 [Desulfobacterales bacterium]|jgi:hypothetical protein
MAHLSRSAGIILVIVVGIVVQLIFSMADIRDTPSKAVVEFSKAYFNLDKSMAKRICKKELVSKDGNVVDQYLYHAAQTAKARGFNIDFLKNKLYHIETETISKTNTEAQIRITGRIRVAINSIYPVIAQMFNIGATHKVDQIIHVIKENGQWKVCGKLFSLTSA